QHIDELGCAFAQALVERDADLLARLRRDARERLACGGGGLQRAQVVHLLADRTAAGDDPRLRRIDRLAELQRTPDAEGAARVADQLVDLDDVGPAAPLARHATDVERIGPHQLATAVRSGSTNDSSALDS